MSSDISKVLRQKVIKRADNCCEYCLLAQRITFTPFEVEHIIPRKHDGTSTFDNLAYACPSCNGFKGTDIASFDPQTGLLTLLYHPRHQNWDKHFRLELDGRVVPLTPEGRVTVKILQINHPTRVKEREEYLEAGLYPG